VTKRALCIGINYLGTSAQLAGCVNDANDWATVLRDRGFEVETLLEREATRANYLERMNALITATGPDDLAVITWSGHGSWQVDRSGDEPDRRDEVICPVDYARAGMISDDDLFKVFTSGHRWARVVFVSDSCHSGSVNRLAPPLEQADATRRVRFLPPAEWMDDRDVEMAARVQHAPAKGKSRLSAALLAACADTEVAYDAWFGSRANGAFTYAALKALAKFEVEPPTYRDWMRGIRLLLPSADYQQTPRLDASAHQARWLALESEGER
jgi:hypothetical protein